MKFLSFYVRLTLPFFFFYFLPEKLLENHEGVILGHVISFTTGLVAACLLSPAELALPWGLL
jgi:hypothetical protein